VQSIIPQHTAGVRGRSRNKHQALLSGLLYCESCATPMVYSYSTKKGRKYPYYLCLNAQRKGWAVCPAKSLPALTIEESILGRIRERSPGVFETAAWEQMDRAQQVQAIQAIVKRIGYDGVAKQVSIRFQPALGAEAQA
jgi:site-specific DNA recombinase